MSAYQKLAAATVQKDKAKKASSKQLVVYLLKENGFVKAVFVVGDVFGTGPGLSLEIFGEPISLTNRSKEFLVQDVVKVRLLEHCLIDLF